MLNSKAAITNWSLPLIKRTSVSKAALQSINLSECFQNT